MHWDKIEKDWEFFKGKVKGKWDKLSDEDLKIIAGKESKLSEKLQEKYGMAKEEVEKQLLDFLSSTQKAENEYYDIGGESGTS